MKPRLSSDVKAVLREMRRHDRAIEHELHRIASALWSRVYDDDPRETGPTEDDSA